MPRTALERTLAAAALMMLGSAPCWARGGGSLDLYWVAYVDAPLQVNAVLEYRDEEREEFDTLEAAVARASELSAGEAPARVVRTLWNYNKWDRYSIAKVVRMRAMMIPTPFRIGELGERGYKFVNEAVALVDGPIVVMKSGPPQYNRAGLRTDISPLPERDLRRAHEHVDYLGTRIRDVLRSLFD